MPLQPWLHDDLVCDLHIYDLLPWSHHMRVSKWPRIFGSRAFFGFGEYLNVDEVGFQNNDEVIWRKSIMEIGRASYRGDTGIGLKLPG